MGLEIVKTAQAVQISPLPFYLMPVSDKKIAGLNPK
jgi:hypothetical protein